MSPIHQLCRCRDTLKIDGSNAECQFCLCSPHPAIRMVVISNRSFSVDRAVPRTMVCLANQAVKQFGLNPAQVVWVERTPFKGSDSSGAGFNLIEFDWLDGHAISSYRSPIYEDWYLSWLETEIRFE